MPCLRTDAGLCIHSKRTVPGTLSERLGVEPPQTHERGSSSRYTRRREPHFRCLSTKALVDSINHVDHLSAIFVQVSGKERVLGELRSDDREMGISSYRDSDGQGGPRLDRAAINALSLFQLDVGWGLLCSR